MYAYRALHAPVCASCRLRATIVAKQLARTRRPATSLEPSLGRAALSTTKVLPQQQRQRFDEIVDEEVDAEAEREGIAYAKRLLANDPAPAVEDDAAEQEGVEYASRLLEHARFLDRGVELRDQAPISPETAALRARQKYGEALPEGVLDEDGRKVYVRLYGEPVGIGEIEVEKEDGGVELDGEGDEGVQVLREGRDGELEEVEIEEEDEMDEDEDYETDELEAEDATGEGVAVTAGDTRLRADMEAAMSAGVEYAPQELDADMEEYEDTDPQERTHPITLANRFGTSPRALPLPKNSLVEPIAAQLGNQNNKHLANSAHKILGGVGLPYSPSTPNRAKLMQQKPIELDAFQHNMSNIEGDVFMSTVLPPTYATIMGVLTETRKRMGTAWAENLVRKAEKGELRILDAGGGGAGVLAAREMLRAEWERMHEERSSLTSGMSLAEADGQLGGPGVSPPLGNASVVTGSDVLRHKASKILENTTFIPRLPDYVHTAEQKGKGKFDLVIAPHTLWNFRFDHERKRFARNLWSLADAEGGVLVLLEKGTSHGFEVVAGAREMLLKTRIKSAASTSTEFEEVSAEGEIEWEGETLPEDGKTKAEVELEWEKEKGTIVAPCTTHDACPMYRPKGVVKGRRDICSFEQRYVRPPFLQNILGARDKNYEDIRFAYVSVVRGRDLLEERNLIQNEAAVEAAFTGHDESGPTDVDSLMLPRNVLKPMKKKGHVIMDLCTPAGSLERWTVPRSFGKQAFRDARKSSWGDLWALGAKTRIPRTPKISTKHNVSNLRGSAKVEAQDLEDDLDIGTELGRDEYGRVVVRGVEGKVKNGGAKARSVAGRNEEGRNSEGFVKRAGRDGGKRSKVLGSAGEGGRMRVGAKVGGLRDKRDKSGRGNGRRVGRVDEE